YSSQNLELTLWYSGSALPDRHVRTARGPCPAPARRPRPRAAGARAPQQRRAPVRSEASPRREYPSAFEQESTLMARVVVEVMPKPEILDPQGKAVAAALPRLGLTGITDVRQGKRFELEVEGTEDGLARARR